MGGVCLVGAQELLRSKATGSDRGRGGRVSATKLLCFSFAGAGTVTTCVCMSAHVCVQAVYCSGWFCGT